MNKFETLKRNGQMDEYRFLPDPRRSFRRKIGRVHPLLLDCGRTSSAAGLQAAFSLLGLPGELRGTFPRFFVGDDVCNDARNNYNTQLHTKSLETEHRTKYDLEDKF
jgi:hypothetical protein